MDEYPSGTNAAVAVLSYTSELMHIILCLGFHFLIMVCGHFDEFCMDEYQQAQTKLWLCCHTQVS